MTATARRPHRKSRNGCKTCKKRRVKCDEKGAPCGPCVLRSINCEYADTSRHQQPTPESVSPQRSVTPSGRSNGEWPGSRRMLELELLHQWTTVTYKSYCGSATAEYFNWQVVVPLLAMKQEYLMHGILAMSALEIATFAQDDDNRVNLYVNIALEYQNTASSGLRRELSNITPDNRQALFALSSILLVLGLASPRFLRQRGESFDILDYVMTILALLKGMKSIADSEPDYLLKEPLINKFTPWSALPIQRLDPQLQHALQALSDLNEDINGNGHGLAGQIGHASLVSPSYHANKQAIFYLREDFARCGSPDTRSYCFGWLLQAGDDYAATLTEKEPVALLALMFWGVMLEQISYGFWWAEGVGRQLVKDLSNTIVLRTDARVEAIIECARLQVGPRAV